MLIEEVKDELGHTLELGGVIHRLSIDHHIESGGGNYLFCHLQFAPNGFNLDQEDINVLYKFLSNYVTEE